MTTDKIDKGVPGPVGPDMYDDPADEGLDVGKLIAWLVEHCNWGGVLDLNGGLIREVLAALQAVGDATLVTNSTYRALRKDAAGIERLNAWLANHGMAERIIEADGDAVTAAINLISPTTTEDR